MADENKQRRKQDPMDYDRAQPTELYREIVRNFIEQEGGSPADVKSLLNSQFSRKMGLLLASMFNKGFDSGVESVRSENGYVEGHHDALKQCLNAVKGIRPPFEEDDPRG